MAITGENIRLAEAKVQMTPIVALTIARLICGMDAPSTNSYKISEDWTAVINAGRKVESSDRRNAMHIEMAKRGLDRPEVWEAIIALDPNQPLKDQVEPANLADCPLLPESARLDPDFGKTAGVLLDSYLKYALAVSPMTPVLFHEFSGLFVASVAISRRLCVPMAYDKVHSNIYGTQIAPTTLFRKSTGLGIPRKLSDQLFPHLMAPQDMTPEAFLSDLAGHQPNKFEDLPEDIQEEWRRGRDFAGQRGLILDEASSLLANAGKEYNSGLMEFFLLAYDCTPKYTRLTRGQGRLIVRNAYLSFLGASTPRAMAVFLADERLWGMGYWPRHALLTPEHERPEWKVPEETNEPPELINGLRNLYQRLPAPKWPDPPQAKVVGLGPGVHIAWEKYNRATSYDLLTPALDQRLWGLYGRLPTQLLKVAMILAALDWPKDAAAPIIELSHLARAMTIVERWRMSAHRALDMATQSGYADFRQRVLRQLSRFEPGGATVRDLCRFMKDRKPDEITDAIRQMLTAGEIEEIESPQGKRGPSTKRYRLAK